MEEQKQKRQTAIKACIKEVVEGKYFQEEGWKPNFVLTGDNRKLMRINLIAAVVGKATENYDTLTVEDSTGEINVRSFEMKFNGVDVGDIVNIIGKPREYGSERYIVPEIIKKVQNKKWIEVRRKELNIAPIEHEVVAESFSEEEIDDNDSEDLIYKIRKMEEKDGVDVENVIKTLKLENGEQVISRLIENGEVFETKPGRIKVLD